MSKENETSCLSAWIPAELHRKVRVVCAERGITIKQFLTDCSEQFVSYNTKK